MADNTPAKDDKVVPATQPSINSDIAALTRAILGTKGVPPGEEKQLDVKGVPGGRFYVNGQLVNSEGQPYQEGPANVPPQGAAVLGSTVPLTGGAVPSAPTPIGK